MRGYEAKERQKGLIYSTDSYCYVDAKSSRLAAGLVHPPLKACWRRGYASSSLLQEFQSLTWTDPETATLSKTDPSKCPSSERSLSATHR